VIFTLIIIPIVLISNNNNNNNKHLKVKFRTSTNDFNATNLNKTMSILTSYIVQFRPFCIVRIMVSWIKDKW